MLPCDKSMLSHKFAMLLTKLPPNNEAFDSSCDRITNNCIMLSRIIANPGSRLEAGSPTCRPGIQFYGHFDVLFISPEHPACKLRCPDPLPLSPDPSAALTLYPCRLTPPLP